VGGRGAGWAPEIGSVRDVAGDLHVHTTASDGTCTPQETVAWADRLGLTAIGITDHDTLAGVPLAEQAAAGRRVRVIGGVEINTSIGDSEVHVLGYGVQPQSSLSLLLAKIRMARQRRVEEIVERLQLAGFAVELQRVMQLAGTATVGRPHVALALQERGYVKSVREAFQRLLGYGMPAYVPRYKITPHQAVEEILAARGVPVLAHPGVLRGRGANVQNLIPSLVQRGLMGLEAYHSEHSAADVRALLNAAKRYGLLVTGGSDCHGSSKAQPRLLGRVRVPQAAVARLLAACQDHARPEVVHSGGAVRHTNL